jgi:quinol-cytochrome oxidoreductase complex cytochrome b subunit
MVLNQFFRYKRRIRTFQYLISSTLLSFSFIFFQITAFVYLAPIFFGLAINLSNEGYFTSKLSPFIIPTSFCLIFVWGTLPFHALGSALFSNYFVATTFGVYSAFLLVSLTLKATLKGSQLNFNKVLISLIFTIFPITIHTLITGQSFNNYDEGETFFKRADLFILLIQSFMALNISLSIEEESSDEGRL